MESRIPHSNQLNHLSKAVLLLFISLPLFGFSLPTQKQEFTQHIVDYIINNHYDSAFSIIDDASNNQKDPLFDVFKLVTIGLRDVDFEKTIDSAFFLTTFKKSISSISNWENVHGASSYSHMLSGMSMLIHASFFLKQKKYFSSMQNVFDALDLLKEAQKADSTNYEIDLFLGLYEYARAELRSRLWWVLFWYPGNRQNGINRVVRSAQKAIVIDEAAKLSLCDIYIQEKQYEKAKQYLTQLKKKYPSSRFVLWAEVKYFEAEKDYESAASVYSHLASQYKIEEMGEYNYIFTKYKQAEMLYRADKLHEVQDICDNLLKNNNVTNYKKLKRDINKLAERCHASNN